MRIMKIMMRFTIAALLFASVTAPAVSADKKRQQKSDEASNARGLFVKKTSDAMTIIVFKLDGGSLVPVAPSTEFKAGDQIKLQLQSNFDGFIYVVNIQPSGKRCLKFPYPKATDNSVRADEKYDIPPPGDVMEFDDEKGTEVLQVIMTRSRIKYLDDALKEPEGCLAQSASSAAAELQAGIAKNVAPVAASTDGNKVRSRDIIFAAGKDKDPSGSVVAIPDNGAGGKLKPGETAEFQIRLKHN
jgi:hypothetical protein